MVKTGKQLNKKTVRQIVEDGHFWHKGVRYIIMKMPAIREGQVITIDPIEIKVSDNYGIGTMK